MYHPLRAIAIAAVGVAALVAVGAGFGLTSHHSTTTAQPAGSICMPVASSTAAGVTITPHTDGFYVGMGENGNVHAIQYYPNDTVHYALGHPGATINAMQSMLPHGAAADFDNSGSFILTPRPGVTNHFVVTSYTGKTLKLTIASTYDCPSGQTRGETIDMQFVGVQVSTQTA